MECPPTSKPHCMYPSAVMDTNGKPMSWRAAIAMEVRDYIGQDYVIPYSFERSSVDGMTNYVGVVGECTIFKPDNRPMRREDILDGTKNTVIVIETHFPTLLWRSPGDLSVAELEQWYELHRDRKPGLLFADGS